MPVSRIYPKEAVITVVDHIPPYLIRCQKKKINHSPFLISDTSLPSSIPLPLVIGDIVTYKTTNRDAVGATMISYTDQLCGGSAAQSGSLSCILIIGFRVGT